MAREPKYKKIRITSQLDPASGDFDIKDIERDIRSMVNNAIKSALSEDEYFRLSPKSLSPDGQYTADLYVHADSASLTQKSMNQMAQTMVFKSSGDPRYDISSPTKVSGRITRALREEERDEREDSESTESKRFTRGSFIKLIGLITSIIDINRRILSTVLTFAQQTAKDMITAHNLGVSYDAVRNYRYIETTHGMKEGTITEAMSDIQNKFGNITSLDENALNALAVVMGNGIKEMVDMGLGASNPDKVVGAIVDAFNEKAYAGYNSVGQYVGEQQARRELYSYLLKISPKVADIFATMQEEQRNINSIFRGKLNTYEDLKNSGVERRGQDIPAEDNVLVTTSQQWNIIKASINAIKESVVRDLAPNVLAILRRIADLRIGFSESQNEAKNMENKQENKAFIERAKKQIELIDKDNPTEAERQRKLALEYYIKKAEKENESTGNISYAVPTADEIFLKGVKLAQNEIEKDFITSDYEYSPEMKHVVDFYIPEAKLNKFKEEYKQDLSSRAQEKADKQVELAKKERKQRRDKKVKETMDNARKWANEQMKDENSPYYSGKNIFGAYKNKGVKGLSELEIRNLAMVQFLYSGSWDSNRQDLWSATPVNARKSLILDYLYYDPLTKSFAGVKPVDIPVEELSKEQEESIRRLALADFDYQYNEEDFYIEAMKKWEDILANHLLNTLKEKVASEALEGTPLYDLDLLQQEFGTNLEGLASFIGKDTWGSIISKASEGEGGQIIHRIILDVKADGKESNDIELMSYITNRVSDTGTVVKQATIQNGNVYVDALADSMSNY